MTYDLTGTFLEVCDCFALCPCWLDKAPDDGECTGVFAWSIEHGTINGTDVGGCHVVSVSYHIGHRHDGGQSVVLFIEDEATDEQAGKLADAFVGRLGGPLGELTHLLGELLDVRRAHISIEQTETAAELAVGTRVRAAARAIIGGSGRPTSLANGALAVTLGSPATVGESEHLRVDLPGIGIDVDVRGRSATSGRFDYHHRSDDPDPDPDHDGDHDHR
jgi:hypothetical protein